MSTVPSHSRYLAYPRFSFPNIALNPLLIIARPLKTYHIVAEYCAPRSKHDIQPEKKRYKRDAGSDPSGSFTIFDSHPLSLPLSLSLSPLPSLSPFIYKTNVQTKETSRINTSLRVAWRALLFPTYPVHVLFPRCRI